jgi:PAS domain S-box-containing protein
MKCKILQRKVSVEHEIDRKGGADIPFTSSSFWRHVMFEQSMDGIVVLDPEGKVVLANPRFAGMLGYAQEELGRLHVRDWDARWIKSKVDSRMEAIGNGGHRFETECRRMNHENSSAIV